MRQNHSKKIIQSITKDVMEAIQSGSLQKWVKPWRSFGFPMNAYTYKYYGLLNTFWLTNDLVKFGFTYPVWATENQWKKLGYALKTGESAKTDVLYPCHIQIPIIPKKKSAVEGGEDELEETEIKYKSCLVHKAYPVLNIAQVNVPESEYHLFVKMTVQNAPESVSQFVQSIKHKMEEIGNDRAAYVVQSDTIWMPKKEYFISEANYWAAYLHELGHWTGAFHRLNRDLSDGIRNYAFEELVAELCSAILAGEFGFSGELQHKEYIGSWLVILENNPRAIVKAGYLAMEAVEYLKKEAKRGMGAM
ncbi:zincin-like metallopeptidase domain-containing protein [Leptospira levettii]|uniref:ArdC family protein n=1 Tax=Leptospira levettii TaxID=2023178 RepID=UPI00223CD5F7|nr:zincin-like metallopeptidase domain-containing protein [Leptospira levettii]MCW7509689.1 zincin-like metallopeptidase domain-containing protein [Leptospira levettii]MCW7520776.1 zincin-like metallopeptidase domain-containing protein [Leptospira levettii]